MAHQDSESSRHFNAGADARIRGEPITAVPKTILAPEWRNGWRYVDRYWGTDATWPVRRLPTVRNAVECDQT